MPLDKHNSITATAMGLIFSLFDVASAREVKSVDMAIARDGFPF